MAAAAARRARAGPGGSRAPAAEGVRAIDGDAFRDTGSPQALQHIPRCESRQPRARGNVTPGMGAGLERVRRNGTNSGVDPADEVSSSLQFEVREQDSWWKDGRIGRVLARSLDESGLWFDFGYGGPSGSRLKKLRSADDLAALSKTWKPGEFALEQAAAVDYGATGVRLSVREGAFAVNLRVCGDDLERTRDTLLDGISTFAARLFEAMESISVLEAGYVMPEVPFPRTRPPRVPSHGFAPGSVLDFFDLRRFQDLGWKKEAEAVARGPLPRGVKRVKAGSLVTIRWISDLGDRLAVGAARSRQEQWVLSQAELRRDARYDERGDLLDKPFDVEELPPLTFYDEDNAVGYKAVVPSAMTGAQWSEFKQWIERGKLPDGTRLEALRLIVPNRALALKLHERAASEGIDAVLYSDDKGRWWNPSPPGPWRER
jgi:hypothetical protein